MLDKDGWPCYYGSMRSKTMNDLDVIKLRRTAQGWVALWQGPHAIEVARVLGTTVVPTAFTAQAEPGLVLRAIAQLNPDALVVLEQ